MHSRSRLMAGRLRGEALERQRDPGGAVQLVIGVQTRRHPRTGQFSIEAAKFDWEAERPERQAAALAMLRAGFSEGERPLVGWQQILLWLRLHGVRNRYGKP